MTQVLNIFAVVQFQPASIYAFKIAFNTVFKNLLPFQEPVLWPQLALCLNHQIEIISVTRECGTPAWGFDRWERLLYHLQTRARGNSHQTCHIGRHSRTPLHIERQSVRGVVRIFSGEKREKREKTAEVYGDVWRKGVRLRYGSPIVFSLVSCICESGFKLFLCKAGTAHTLSVCKAYREKELSAYYCNNT